jgi:hypothetical protein
VELAGEGVEEFFEGWDVEVKMAGEREEFEVVGFVLRWHSSLAYCKLHCNASRFCTAVRLILYSNVY